MSIFTAGDRTPFTYLIKCIPTGELYYGVRYAKGCQPLDLWSTYFTSSKKLSQRLEIFGKDAFEYSVRKTFDCAHKSRLWEHKVLKRLNVVNNPKWLNTTNGVAFKNRTPSSLGKKLVYIYADNNYKYLDQHIAEYVIQRNLGELKGPPKPINHGKKVSQAMKGKPKTSVHIAASKLSFQLNPKNKGYSIYNNGHQEVRVYQGDSVPEGYYRGVITKRPSIPSKNKGKSYDEIYGQQKSDEIKENKSQQLKSNNPSKKMKGKTYEELYGRERAQELKDLRSSNSKKNSKEYYIWNNDTLLFCGSRIQAEKFLCGHLGRKTNPLYNKDLLQENNIKVETRRRHR
jgi:hypothetical protein